MESFNDYFEKFQNIAYRQDIPETVSQDYKSWSETAINNINLLKNFDCSNAYGINKYATSLSTYLIDLVLTETEMGFSTDTLLGISQ